MQGHALVHLQDIPEQRLGSADVEVKELGAGLVADAQQVLEAARDDEGAGRRRALKQGVCGDGGAHLDGLDAARVDLVAARDGVARGDLEDAADALCGRIGVVGRVVTEQLHQDIWLAGDNSQAVGEGAAAVNGDADLAGLVAIGDRVWRGRAVEVGHFSRIQFVALRRILISDRNQRT